MQQEHTFSPSYISCRSASFLHLTQIYSSLITTKMSQFLQDGGKECDGQTTVIVHFLDNSSTTVLADEQTTVEEALEELFGRLLISDPRIKSNHFGLYESVDGNLVGDRLLSREKILNVQNSCAKIIMQYRLLIHSIPLSTCKMARQLLYVQCLHRIITGYY